MGNGTYLSEGGVKYHVDWLRGAKVHHNLTFTLIGVWNEAPWTKEYIVLLRKGLDDAGLHDVGIIAADGLPDIITDAAADAELAAAIAAFGVHAHVLPAAPDARRLGIPYYNSENDLVDGVLPQWGGANKPGTNWPLAFMLNYIEANGTATMLCPFIHGWSMNLGRHNHGPAFFNDPWSGFYQLGAPFFTQAQWTQFTEPGWHFIAGGAGKRNCPQNPAAAKTLLGGCYLTYASLAPVDGSEFTIVVVNEGAHPVQLTLQLAGTLSKFAGTAAGKLHPLQQWRSIETEYFTRKADVPIPSNGTFTVALSPSSVTTFSTRAGAGWANYTVPERTQFTMPFYSNFSAQAVDEPCHSLSPIYGAFEVAAHPHAVDRAGGMAVHPAGGGGGSAKVCKAAVPQNPGPNAWTHRVNGWPITTTPSGSNFANVVVEATATIEPGGGGAVFASTICGRVPIFAPALCKPTDFALGVCLTIMMDNPHATVPTSGAAPGGVAAGSLTWRLTEAQNQLNQPNASRASVAGARSSGSRSHGCNVLTTLATGTIEGGGGFDSHRMKLKFSEGTVFAYIDGKAVGSSNVTMTAGVAALGTAWNTALFDAFAYTPHPDHPPTPGSFLYDVLPSQTTINNITGYAGFALNLSALAPTHPPLVVARLGRFKSVGNTGVHQLGVARGSDGSWLLEPSAATAVSMDACTPDMLGFCYSQKLAAPLLLPQGELYYIVSSETAGGDVLVDMSMSATGADYASYRSGDTFLSYQMPTGGGAAPMAAGSPLISGKVFRLGEGGAWTATSDFPNIDTSFGPVNMVLSD